MELIMVSYECDKKNRFFNITDWSQSQIKQKINEFDKKLFFAHIRTKT